MSNQDQLEQSHVHARDEAAHGPDGQDVGPNRVSIVLTVPLPAARPAMRGGRHPVVDQVRSLRRSIGDARLGTAEAEILVIDGGALGMSDIAPLQAQSARAVPAPRSATGRAALRNCGLARAAHPLVLFVDAEIELGETLLPALLAVARDPEVGAVGPWLVPSSERADRPAQQEEVSGLAGGCLLVRREPARRARGFSEVLQPDLAADVDFGLRLRAAGHRIVCTPSGGATGPAPGARIEDPRVMAALSGVWDGVTREALDGNQVLAGIVAEPSLPELPPPLQPGPTAAYRPGPAAVPQAGPAVRLDSALPEDEWELRDILLGLMTRERPAPSAFAPEPPPEPTMPTERIPQPAVSTEVPARPPVETAPVAAWSRSKPIPAGPPTPAPVPPAPARRSSWRRSV